MDTPIEVIEFDHLVLNCANIQKSLEFYVDTLGMEPVRVDEWRAGETPFPSARVSPDTIIDFFEVPPEGNNVDHICLVIANTDLDAVAAGFDESRRGDGLFGARGLASSVYVTDPDGNTVELRSYDAAPG